LELELRKEVPMPLPPGAMDGEDELNLKSMDEMRVKCAVGHVCHLKPEQKLREDPTIGLGSMMPKALLLVCNQNDKPVLPLRVVLERRKDSGHDGDDYQDQAVFLPEALGFWHSEVRSALSSLAEKTARDPLWSLPP
jgi:hypothetical protein